MEKFNTKPAATAATTTIYLLAAFAAFMILESNILSILCFIAGLTTLVIAYIDQRNPRSTVHLEIVRTREFYFDGQLIFVKTEQQTKTFKVPRSQSKLFVETLGQCVKSPHDTLYETFFAYLKCVSNTFLFISGVSFIMWIGACIFSFEFDFAQLLNELFNAGNL